MALNATTAAKIDHGLAALRLDQLTGAAPPPGEVSVHDIARRAGVSPATIQKLELIARAKIANAILADPDLPPSMARKLSSLLNP